MKKRVDNDKLILLVHRKNPLWDKDHEQFFNKIVKHKLWDEIAMQMENPRNVVKRKWKSLRDVFRRELKKTLECKAAGSSYKPEWSHFESMLFLKDQLSLGELNKLKGEAKIECDTEDHNMDEDLDLMKFLTPHVPSASSAAADQEQDPENDDDVTIVSEKLITSTPNKRIHHDHDNEVMMGYEIREVPEKREILQETQDDDYYFVMSLLPYMRTVSTVRKLSMRMRIMQVIQEENDITGVDLTSE